MQIGKRSALIFLLEVLSLSLWLSTKTDTFLHTHTPKPKPTRNLLISIIHTRSLYKTFILSWSTKMLLLVYFAYWRFLFWFLTRIQSFLLNCALSRFPTLSLYLSNSLFLSLFLALLLWTSLTTNQRYWPAPTKAACFIYTICSLFLSFWYELLYR